MDADARLGGRGGDCCHLHGLHLSWLSRRSRFPGSQIDAPRRLPRPGGPVADVGSLPGHSGEDRAGLPPASLHRARASWHTACGGQPGTRLARHDERPMDAAPMTDDELLAALAPLSLRSDPRRRRRRRRRGPWDRRRRTTWRRSSTSSSAACSPARSRRPATWSDGRRREVAASVAFQAVVAQVANPVVLAAEVLGVGIDVEPGRRPLAGRWVGRPLRAGRDPPRAGRSPAAPC